MPGQYGIVYKGYILKIFPQKYNTVVAIKTLKGEYKVPFSDVTHLE